MKCLIWDIDGTLLNTKEGLLASYKYTLQQLGLPELPDEEIFSFIGPPPQDIFMNKFHLTKVQAQQGADIFRERYKKYDLLKATPYIGIMESLRFFHNAGIKQAVATNKRQDYAVDICKYFGIDHYCSPIMGTDNTSSLGKSDLIIRCLNAMGQTDKNMSVMIGDTNGDKKAAEEAGILFLGVNYGFGIKNNPEYVDIPDDIPKYIRYMLS